MSLSSSNTQPAVSASREQEIKEAELIFKDVWAKLETELGREKLQFPREIFWLNGAPGSGKGTQTRFIMGLKGIKAEPVVISDLLTSPEAKKLKDAGLMVGDREVIGIFFRRLLELGSAGSVIVDGFPRTPVQAECLRFFSAKLNELKSIYAGSSLESGFPGSVFHIVVLTVNEKISVERQLSRGEKARAAAAASGEEIRATDMDSGAALKRFKTFNELTCPALLSLKDVFHYHHIDAEGSIEGVQAQIIAEMN
jgi:adenylate kinase